MTTWEERMALRAVEREQTERERRSGPWRAFVEARDGYFAETLGSEYGSEHEGHHVHSHAYHVNSSVCSCGQVMGVWTVLLDEEFQQPSECPICRDYPDFIAGIDPEETP